MKKLTQPVTKTFRPKPKKRRGSPCPPAPIPLFTVSVIEANYTTEKIAPALARPLHWVHRRKGAMYYNRSVKKVVVRRV